jgi:predicted transposase YbfD/YdcC
VLGQVATDEKSNETTAVPKLLEMLSLKGAIVTADALNCQRAIATQVVEQGGDYVLALKGNQGTLHANLSLYFNDPAHAAAPATSKPEVEGDHGRIETRQALVCSDIAWLQEHHQWPGLAAIGKVVRSREIHRLHWVLGVTMNEDQSRARMDHAPHNLVLMRRWALNACKLKGSKGSMKGKLKRAGWDDSFLAHLLTCRTRNQMR